MGNIKLLLVVIAAFGLTDSKRMFRKCTFCRYFYSTGHSPYELLWILADEISAHLSEDQKITLFLDEEDLTKAELVFETFCEKVCNKNSLPGVRAEMAGTAPRSASRLHNDSETSPEYKMPNRSTLFKKVEIPPQAERAPSAEEAFAGTPARSSGTTGEERASDGSERARRQEFRKHSGEYEISGTLLSNGSSGVNSGSAGIVRAGSVSGNDTAVGDSESKTDCSDPPCGYHLV